VGSLPVVEAHIAKTDKEEKGEKRTMQRLQGWRLRVPK
jgi:hypothetical protein